MAETYYIRTDLCYCALSPASNGQHANILSCLKRIRVKELPVSLEHTLWDISCPVFNKGALTVFTSCKGLERDDSYLKQQGIEFDAEQNTALQKKHLGYMNREALDCHKNMQATRRLIDLEKKIK